MESARKEREDAKFFGEIHGDHSNGARMHWMDVPIHFIDFEGSLSSGILEFGVVTLRNGAIASTQTRLCRALGRIRAEDVMIHGLTESLLADRAPFSDEFANFAELREAGPFAAHYAHAENSLLKSVWAYPRVVPDFARPGFSLAEWGPWVDTGRLYGELFPQLETGKLEQLILRFDLQAELDRQVAVHCPSDRSHYHAALYDALAGAVLLLAALARPSLFGATIPWLLQMSTANAEKRADLRQTELF